MTNVSFKISSALKTIIGRELITDDFIAVFELVKNAFDANAKRVDITFSNLYALDQPEKITISDNGDGMDKVDIENKWLFVAYSAKKSQADYRDKIKSERIFAGAKGIGRFSCDRLGSGLKMTTRKKGDKGKWHVLEVDWNKFEQDSEREFQTIKATYKTSDSPPVSGLKHGTVLEITGLRNEDWDRAKLLKLRRSLERLINPNQENDPENFSIHLNVPDELLSDKETKKKKPDEPWEIVNGPIRNFLLEALDLKTTQIQVEIDRDGQLVLTKLTDRGNEIYELLERNPNPDILKDIKISLFFMNRAAKSAFTRRMGLEPVKYGSVFLYKNGFRIHPFGDAGEDGLDIDKRKQQGLFRRLGTRDLSGRIEINGANPEFRETSSRDGGLIKNAAFYALKNFFQEFVLNRLEAYVMNVARYGVLGDQPEITDPNLPQLREETLELIKKLTRSKDIVDFNFDPKVLDLIESKSPDNLSGLIKNLKRISVESNNLELSKEIDKAEKRVLELLKAKEEAERTEEEERQRAINAEQKVQQAIEKAEEAEELARKASTEAEEARLREEMLQTQNIFLKGALSRDLQHVLTLHHSIGQNALNIEQYVTNILRLISTDRIDDVQRLKRYLTGISFSAKKIDSISRFATRANFRAEIEEMTSDLIGFIREYLLNVYEGSIEDPDGDLVPIKFTQPNNIAFVTKFAPLNVSMIFDNLLSNSRKHGAREVTVNILECKSDHLKISFADDGRGIPSKYLPQLFKLGFSTTDGSGLGLYHVQELMTKMKGGISVNPDRETGAEFILDFAKRP